MNSMIKAGYTEQYAKKLGFKMLDQPKLAAEVKRIRSRLNETADKSAVDVVNEYARVAFVDRTEFLKDDPDNPGQLIYKAPHELTKDQKALIEKVHVHKVTSAPDKDGKTEVIREEYSYTLLDKANALQQMGRHFGIFDDKLRIGITQNPFKNVSSDKLAQIKSLMHEATKNSLESIIDLPETQYERKN